MQKLLFVVVTLCLSSYHITCSDKSSPYCAIYDASRCPQNIPTKVIKFSDLQSSFFSRKLLVEKKILEVHPGQLRLISKNFPLTFHNKYIELTNKAVLL